MQLGICSHPDDLSAYDQIDFDFIEGHVQSLLVPEQPESGFVPHAAAVARSRRPMRTASCFLPADLKVCGPQVDLPRLLRYAETAFARAAAIHVPLLVFGSGGARQVPPDWSVAEGFEQLVDALNLMAPLAGNHGVTLALEPLCREECNLVNTVLEGAVAVARVNHPNVRLHVDFFHMLRNGESPDDIVKAGAYIVHAHVAENRNRAQPGVHGEDFSPFLQALSRIHYAGDLVVECVWTQPPIEASGPAIAALRSQLAPWSW